MRIQISTGLMTTHPEDRSEERADIREDLVARVKAEIAAGTYETEEKWETALEKLMGDMV